MLRHLLPASVVPARRDAATLISGLPAYQIALWPDGWVLETNGSVLIQDTHAMAEARRWYALADRNKARENGRRLMSMLGIDVPRVILDLSNRRFPSQQVASVAVQLVAREWVEQRRRQLLQAPKRALLERSICWRGSRHAPEMESETVAALIRGLIRVCVGERLIPDASYLVRVCPRNGYGILAYRCELHVDLDRQMAAKVLDVLGTALVPWNRVVARDGGSVPLIGLGLSARHRAI